MAIKRIIRIAASAAGALFLLGGCARIAIPEPDGRKGAVIGFNPGTMLLKDDASTKSATFKDGFEVGDIVTVYGRRHGNDGTTDVFSSTPVEKKSASEWEYDAIKFWNWLTEGDYYDFLGVYPSGKGTAKMDIPGNLAIKTHYSISANNNFDLMYALYRRYYGSEADRLSAVPLEFHHTLSAVRIVFDNDSNSKDITINSYQFTHMIVSADAKATINSIGNPEISWINTIRNADAVRSVTPNKELKGMNNSGDHSYTGAFDFFIPTALDATSDGSADDQERMPHLVINYTPAGKSSATQVSLLLKDIERDPLNGDYTPVEVWEPGVRYTYHVSIRMDGGVHIIVVTTDWEDIYAETPGIMID